MSSSEFAVRLETALNRAITWLTTTATNHENIPIGIRGAKLKLNTWAGAIRGEYRAATKQWDSFCPIWHTGQAVKALVLAAEVKSRPELLEYAKYNADFVLTNQVVNGPDAGMLLAFEDHPGKDYVNTSAVLEALDGLFLLFEATGDHRYCDSAINALYWVKNTAWKSQLGVFEDLYDIHSRRFIHGIQGAQGRPLLDDAVFLTGYKLSGDQELREVAQSTAETLVRNEFPSGNWLNYGPCVAESGRFHPRHAFWWGNPMLEMYQETGDVRFRDCFLRAAEWYVQALRLDGGMFRETGINYNTESFGHATSGSAGAAIILLRAHQLTGNEKFLKSALSAFEFCLQMQFTCAEDSNLQGAILEKVLPPSGSDRSPYHIRDLGTIFFIQAASMYLKNRKNNP